MLEALQGGAHLRITTYSLLRRKRSFVTAVDDVVASGSECMHLFGLHFKFASRLNKALIGITGQMTLKVKGKLFKFLVDGQGKVHDRKLMNAIIATRRQW
jgi:hypothetical protein